MRKNWIWIAVVIIVLVGGAFFLMNGGADSLMGMNNTSLRSLLSSNSSQKCSFNNAQSTGTIYVGMGEMRGDFSSKEGQASAQNHMVIANSVVYVWADGTNAGYRMAFDDMKPGGSSEGIDADAKVATNCSPWQATESSFTLPTNVNFMALGGVSAQASTSAQ